MPQYGLHKPFVVVLLLGGLLVGCDDDRRMISDSIPPARVTDLVVGRPLGNSLTAAWTVSGDDGTEGQATYFDLRYSKEPITEATWSRALRFTGPIRPFPPGVFQGGQVFGLDASTQYYFALRVADEEHNWSEISNVGSAITSGYSDSLPPSPIDDLVADSTSSFTISLSWTAPGDDGMNGRASVYDARFSVLPITTEAHWTASARLIGEPIPAMPGERQEMTITGLIPDRSFYFAIRAGDEIVNWAPLSQQLLAQTRPAEIIAPAAVTDLTIGLVTLTSVQLYWTTPGDDGNLGQAAEYDIRHYHFPITDIVWGNCGQVQNEPHPGQPGSLQTMWITELQPYRVYFMAIKTSDEIPNWSPLSNVVSFVTDGGGTAIVDTIPPAKTVSLAVIATSRNAVTLRWRSSGDDANAGNPVYNDLRYSTDSITDSNWETSTVVEYVLPARAAGTIMTMDVIDLEPGTVYYFGLKTGDEIPNWSQISNIARGETLP